jgi:hypothetical protein
LHTTAGVMLSYRQAAASDAACSSGRWERHGAAYALRPRVRSAPSLVARRAGKTVRGREEPAAAPPTEGAAQQQQEELQQQHEAPHEQGQEQEQPPERSASQVG